MRNSSALLLLFLGAIACGGKMDRRHPVNHADLVAASVKFYDGNINLTKSVVRWKGTKLLKSRYHEGTVRLHAGSLSLEGGIPTGGTLVADMSSIEVTDIPDHEPEARANLVRHLKSDFDSRQFPYARFDFTQVEHTSGVQKICGDMQIKGITREVCFEATGQNGYWQAHLTLSRSQWNIGAEGSWLEKRLVDDEFYLNIQLWIE